MTLENEEKRSALREIETRAANALANQPEDTDAAGRHMAVALADIWRISSIAAFGKITHL